jgi:hypothetical protein
LLLQWQQKYIIYENFNKLTIMVHSIQPGDRRKDSGVLVIGSRCLPFGYGTLKMDENFTILPSNYNFTHRVRIRTSHTTSNFRVPHLIWHVTRMGSFYGIPASGTTLVDGVSVVLNIWATHRNPACWGPDADQFRPERFLEGPLQHPAQFQPFSLPMRNCLGWYTFIPVLMGKAYYRVEDYHADRLHGPNQSPKYLNHLV